MYEILSIFFSILLLNSLYNDYKDNIDDWENSISNLTLLYAIFMCSYVILGKLT